MGHNISGIITARSRLEAFAKQHDLHPPTALRGSLAFLPLNDKHLDALFPSPKSFDSRMRCLSEALKETLASLSQDVPIAYVETEYFGGIGEQSATAYHLGVCILEPQTDVSGPISAALQMLGVQRGNHIDEFAAAGLDRFRNNEGWMEAAEE